MQDMQDYIERGRRDRLPGHLGIDMQQVEHGAAYAEMPLQRFHLAPNGYLHAGSVVTLADSCCGYGCTASLPEGASGFTTVELKSNHLGTALDGTVVCQSKLIHGGRSTQVWDAEVAHKESGKTLALFRCTQMILYPR